MRAPWLLLALPVACGPSFEADGTGAAGSASTSASVAPSGASSSPGSTSVSTVASQASASTSSTGIVDPCLSGDYSGCIALDAPTLYFSFSEGAADVIHSTLPTDDDVQLERDGMGSVIAGDLIGTALDMTTAGYEVLGSDLAGMYAQLFEGDHAHTVEMWIANPRVEAGFSQTLFLTYGAIPYGDPPDYTAASAFMTMDNGVPHLTTQRRVFDGLDNQVLITATSTLDDQLEAPAHIFVVYQGQGVLTLCRNTVCTTSNGTPGSGLDYGRWYLGYNRDTQSFSGLMDEVAFYEGALDDSVMKRHCEAGFIAMGLPTTPCTP